jgi:hypothetical protein
MSEMNGAGIEPARERVEQVGAMIGVVGRAITLRRLLAVVELDELAGLHVAGVHAGRRPADGRDLVADADRLQRLDGLRAGVDGGADLAQRRGGLEDLRLDGEFPQRIRRREAGEPAADDCDRAFRHSDSPGAPRQSSEILVVSTMRPQRCCCCTR